MPFAPPTPCNKPGCHMLTTGKYCELHKDIDKQLKQAKEAMRESAHGRGYTSRWRRYSKNRRKYHPLCERCGHPAQVTDHIIPHKGDMVLFWDGSNHQSLCKKCHDTKTAKEDGGYGNG